jgi:hypothetical protein
MLLGFSCVWANNVLAGSHSSSNIVQYFAAYEAGNITALGDSNCRNAELIFKTFALSVFKYKNKYSSSLGLISVNHVSAVPYVSLYNNMLNMQLKDKEALNANGTVLKVTFDSNFDIKTKSLPDKVTVYWDAYYYGDLQCRYVVEGSKISSSIEVYSNSKHREIYRVLKEAFELGDSSYFITVK